MRNRTKILGVMVLVSFVSGGCAKKDAASADTSGSAAPPASTDRSADAAMILATDSGWIRNVMAKNVDSLMTYYSSDVVSYGFGAAPASGMDQLRASYTDMVKTTMTNPSMAPNPVEFSNDGTMAYDYGTFTMTTTPPGGKASRSTGGYLNVWRKTVAGWKLVAEMSTPVATPK